MIKDMGRALSHRVIIVNKWLQGQEYSQIALSTNHSPEAVSNYIRRFKQVVALAEENYEVHTIAFLAQISRPLSEEYIKIWHQAQITPMRREELGDFKKKQA
jgi:preprotein translocase subunit Sss1